MSQVAETLFEDSYTPDVIPSQDRLNRYWDPLNRRRAVKIKPGEYCFSSTNEMLVTVVGSSVALCVRDKKQGRVGMLHFMLPVTGFSTIDVTTSSLAQAYGRHAMTTLLRGFYTRGSTSRSLDAFLIGGTQLWPTTARCTDATLGLARFCLAENRIGVSGEFLGGNGAKKVHFTLTDICPSVSVLQDYNDTIREREMAYLRCLRADWILGHRRTSMRLGKLESSSLKTVRR